LQAAVPAPLLGMSPDAGSSAKAAWQVTVLPCGSARVLQAAALPAAGTGAGPAEGERQHR